MEEEVSKKDVPAIISGIGLLCSFVIKLFDWVKIFGGSAEGIYEALKENEPLIKDFALLIVKNEMEDKYKFDITVNYDDCLGEVGYDEWVDQEINNLNFPAPRCELRKKEVEVYLIKGATVNEVLRSMDKKGLEPADVFHADGFRKKFPLAQIQFPIIFLGSCFNDGFLQLTTGLSSKVFKFAFFSYFDKPLDSSIRFAAVKKRRENT